MATESMIAMACLSDADLFKPPLQNTVAYGNVLGELEEETDPAELARAARWPRREQPKGWREALEALGLPDGGPLTRWEDDPAAALLEARTDALPEPAVPVPVSTPARPPVLPRRSDDRRRSVPTRPDWSWQDDAACKGESLVLFFGADGERQPEKDVRERKAKAICARCPVRNECLDYALSRPEKYGVWSLNEDERASERRRRMRRANIAGVPAYSPDDGEEVEHCLHDASKDDDLSCRSCQSKQRQEKEAVA